MTQQSISIELQLVEPPVTGRRLINKRGKLWRHKLRHRHLARAREIFDLLYVHWCMELVDAVWFAEEKLWRNATAKELSSLAWSTSHSVG